MPKIHAIKARLQQQQRKLQESQTSLTVKDGLALGNRDPVDERNSDSPSGDGYNEPLSLVSRNHDNRERDSGLCPNQANSLLIRNTMAAADGQFELESNWKMYKIGASIDSRHRNATNPY